MQKAVQAKNFKIPLDQLATYFEFATKRAIQTGESVDYLVDSIITGIGRKSVLVMDNLGISAIELQKEVEKVGDFGIAAGNIIRRELTSMGDVASTTATNIARISTAWTDFKTNFGTWITSSPLFEKFANAMEARANSGAGNINDPYKVYRGAPKENLILSKSLVENEVANAKNKASLIFWRDALIVINEELDKIAKPKGGPIADESTVKSVSDLVDEIKKGAEESEKMAKAWEIIHKEISDSKGGPISVVPTGQITIPQLGSTPGAKDILAPGPQMPGAEDYTQEWENTWNEAIQSVTDFMSEAFIDVFAKIGEGSFADFGKNLLTSFGNLLANLGKMLMSLGTTMLLALTLLKVPTIPTAIAAIAAGAAAMAIGGLMIGAAKASGKSMTAGSTTSSAGNYENATQQQYNHFNINVQGTIKGRDIELSLRRQRGL
jgi:hypothetical protein